MVRSRRIHLFILDLNFRRIRFLIKKGKLLFKKNKSFFEKKAVTYSPGYPVPSALIDLTALFGMGSPLVLESDLLNIPNARNR